MIECLLFEDTEIVYRGGPLINDPETYEEVVGTVEDFVEDLFQESSNGLNDKRYQVLTVDGFRDVKKMHIYTTQPYDASVMCLCFNDYCVDFPVGAKVFNTTKIGFCKAIAVEKLVKGAYVAFSKDVFSEEDITNEMILEHNWVYVPITDCYIKSYNESTKMYVLTIQHNDMPSGILLSNGLMTFYSV